MTMTHIAAGHDHYDAQSGGGIRAIVCTDEDLQKRYAESLTSLKSPSIHSFLDLASMEGWEVYAVDKGYFYLRREE